MTQKTFFGEGRLLEVLEAKLEHPAQEVQEAVLMIVVRDLAEARADD